MRDRYRHAKGCMAVSVFGHPVRFSFDLAKKHRLCCNRSYIC